MSNHVATGLQYKSKILGPKYAHKRRLCVKRARVCVFDTRRKQIHEYLRVSLLFAYCSYFVVSFDGCLWYSVYVFKALAIQLLHQ